MEFKLNDYCVTNDGQIGQVTNISAAHVAFPITVNWVPGGILDSILRDSIQDTYTIEGKFWDDEGDYDEGDEVADIKMVITKEDNPEYFL